MRRRNSDDRFRELIRRISAGDHSLIPALARQWERQGELGSSIAPDALREVVAAFERLERSLATDDPRVLLSADVVAGDRDAGFLFGVMTALGLTADELWDESERARGGAGNSRLQRRRARARRDELEFWYTRAVQFATNAGLDQDEAELAVSYMIDFPEEAERATNSRSLALAALQWHCAVWDGNVQDAEGVTPVHENLPSMRRIQARAAKALAAFEASQP